MLSGCQRVPSSIWCLCYQRFPAVSHHSHSHGHSRTAFADLATGREVVFRVVHSLPCPRASLCSAMTHKEFRLGLRIELWVISCCCPCNTAGGTENRGRRKGFFFSRVRFGVCLGYACSGNAMDDSDDLGVLRCWVGIQVPYMKLSATGRSRKVLMLGRLQCPNVHEWRKQDSEF